MKLRIKLLTAFLCFFPFALSAAAVSGIDDVKSNLSIPEQQRLDDAITTYYLHPSVDKVNTVLDIMTKGELVRKKTAWAPLVGFLSIIFADNKNHVMAWISRNDYNLYAQDIIITALLHAKLNETALVFAQASRWKQEDIVHIRGTTVNIDYKNLPVILPGHIDTLWGVFFASGDPRYVNEVIDVLFMTATPHSDTVAAPADTDTLNECKALARYSLTHYAVSDAIVHKTLDSRLKAASRPAEKKVLEALLAAPR